MNSYNGSRSGTVSYMLFNILDSVNDIFKGERSILFEKDPLDGSAQISVVDKAR